MASNLKLVDVSRAAETVNDGDTVYFGGTVLDRKPMELTRALIRAGKRDLDVVTFAGSLEIELLVAAGSVRSVAAAYIGLGRFGPAPRFVAGVKAGVFDDLEYSEWSLLGRLRAASMGIPFLPTRAGTGSETLAIHNFASVADPYSGDNYVALPPLQPDITVLHAWRASPSGHVQIAFPPQHLWDIDVLAARAADRVIVGVDQIVSEEEIASIPEHTRLFGFEVDMVVELPGGSWPTSSPPEHDVDEGAIGAYVSSGGDAGTLNSARPS